MIQKLIDAYELEREMYRKCIDTDEEIEKGRAKWDSGLWIRYKVFEDTIILAPTVDPVKPGHWIIRDIPRTEWYKITCSECGEDVTSSALCIGFLPNARVLWDYCPYCGAKMDEVAEDG